MEQAQAEQGTESQQQQQPSAMERLPDELLVMVLSEVRDAATLLDTVPLVCRRWRRLAPLCWDGVPVRLECRDNTTTVKDARLLLRAPASARLHLHLGLFERFYGPHLASFRKQAPVKLPKMLQRSTAKISELSTSKLGNLLLYHDISGAPSQLHEVLAQLIDANVDHLQKLIVEFGMLDADDVADKMMARLPGLVVRCPSLRSLLCPLSCLPAFSALPSGLSSLCLDLLVDSHMPRPADTNWPAAGSLPGLRSVALLNMSPCECRAAQRAQPDHADTASWAGDLLLALARAAPNATRVAVTCSSPGHDCSCSTEALSGPLAEALASLPRLRRLELHGRWGLLPFLAAQSLESLTALQLDVFCWANEEKGYDFEGHEERCCEAMRRQAAQLSERNPHIDIKLKLIISEPTTINFEWKKRV